MKHAYDICSFLPGYKNDIGDKGFRISDEKNWACADPDSFARWGPTTTTFYVCFLVYDRKEYPNTTVSGPSPASRGNAFQMVFRWRADDGPTLNSGLVAL